MYKYDETWKHLSKSIEEVKIDGDAIRRNRMFSKITKRLCWSILMAGMGYALAYYHWMAWAEKFL
jgi:hypothetical protein